MHIVTSFPPYFISFLHSLPVSPTWIYVAVVALFFGLITDRFVGVILIPVLAAAIFLAAQVIGPVILSHSALTIPTFDLAFAKLAAAAYIVFLVLDTVVFAVKKAIKAIFFK